MKAIVVGDGKSLHWTEVPEPELGPGEVLVQVHATALNRADLLQRAGKYAPPPGASQILGLEMAGVVGQVGEGVTGWREGDRVCALLSGGGYAERVTVHASQLMPVPGPLSMEEAAGVPEVFLTAYSALFWEGRASEGESVLIHAGASGVGTAAIQLAQRAGCRVFVTAGSNRKTAACRELGAELAVNYREDDFVEKVMEVMPDGVDVIIDCVARNYFERNLELLAVRGRLVFLATLSGSKVELDIRRLMGKRLTLVGATLRARGLEEKAALKDEFVERFGPDLEGGEIEPIIDRVFPIEQVEEAHEYMQENRNIGKVILRVRSATTPATP